VKRTRAVKASVSMLANEVTKLNADLTSLRVKYSRVKGLLDQALSHRHRLEFAVKAVGAREGTCWCGINAFRLTQGKECVLHTVACDQVYLAIYGAERGE
jgi:hypothetical protein